eukprot:scaffold1460_cov417-Prasinococcus_capsulatus_cf.AAC.3
MGSHTGLSMASVPVESQLRAGLGLVRLGTRCRRHRGTHSKAGARGMSEPLPCRAYAPPKHHAATAARTRTLTRTTTLEVPARRRWIVARSAVGLSGDVRVAQWAQKCRAARHKRRQQPQPMR